MISAYYRGWMAGNRAQRPVRYREELSSERTGLSVQGQDVVEVASDAARRRAGIARPRCVRGLRGVSPQDDLPKSSRAWGCPPPFPRGGGHVHPCTPQFVPSRIGHASPAELRSAAILDRELDTQAGIRSVSVFRTSCRRGPSPIDVSSIATACTAFSGVLVGFAALENDELIHEAPAIVGCRTPSALDRGLAGPRRLRQAPRSVRKILVPNGPGHSPRSGVNAASRVAVIRPAASPASSRPAAVSSAAACMRL